MAISFPDSSRRLNELAVNFLWRQWSSIGVAGGARMRDGWMIDPEALVLATTRFGRYDPRLMDESLDWLVKYGRRINIQRLESLHREWPGVADGRVLVAIANILSRQSVLRKWRALAEPDFPVGEEPLFLNSDGSPLPVFGEPDAAFRNAGLLRSPVSHRGMSKPPDPTHSGNLIFLLRAFMGVNLRSEIFAWLLVHGGGQPATIARDTGYFIKSVQLTLNEMEESGQILSARQGRDKLVRIIKDDWSFLMKEEDFPIWLDWMPLLAILTRLADTFAIPDLQEKPEHLQAIRVREALEQLAPAIHRLAITLGWRTTPELRGAELLHSLFEDLHFLLD